MLFITCFTGSGPGSWLLQEANALQPLKAQRQLESESAVHKERSHNSALDKDGSLDRDFRGSLILLITKKQKNNKSLNFLKLRHIGI